MRPLAALVLLLSMLGSSLPLAAFPAAAAGPPPGSDWLITQNTAISDQTIWMDWNLTVKAGARLELTNVSLNFNRSAGRPGGILVEAGASLKMVDCVLNDQIASGESFFVAYGDLELSGTTLRELGAGGGRGGLQLLGGTHILKDTRIYNFHYIDTIYCSQARLDLRGTNLSDNYGRGIVAEYSVLEVQNCNFTGMLEGMTGNYSAVNVTGCYFEQGYNPCCIFYYSSVQVKGCDFGSRRAAPLATQAPVADPAYELTVQNCEFISDYTGVLLYRSSDYWTDYCAIILVNPQDSLVWNDTFGYLSRGIVAFRTASARILANQFHMESDCIGVVCRGYYKGECLIEGNRFDEGQAVALESGHARIENNNITLGAPGHYYSGDNVLHCGGPAEVLCNTIRSKTTNSIYAIYIDGLSKGETATIAGNRIEGAWTAIQTDYVNGRVDARDNVITNCTTGIYFNCGADITNNTISRTDVAITAGYRYYLIVDDLSIIGNTVSNSDYGIEAFPYAAPLEISDNSLTCNISAILVESRGAGTATNVTIEHNNITANGTGIEMTDLNANPNNGSVGNNSIHNCEFGIKLDNSRINLKDNRLYNISAWGVHATDTTGDLNGSVAYFNASAVNACQIVKLWSLDLVVKYNPDLPGDPERWYTTVDYELGVEDSLGRLVYDGYPRYSTLTFKEYQVRANGTRVDFNPYKLTASKPSLGVGRSEVVLTSAKSIEVRMYKGPDMLPIALNMSNDAPFEGELLFFCATVLNNGTYNPGNLQAYSVDLWLVLDGIYINSVHLDHFPTRTTWSFSTAWVASAGWHNVSVSIGPDANNSDVLPENNVLTRMFFVAGLPVGRLEANGTDFNAWEPVNFSTLVETTEHVAGYRYDFGDGHVTEWLPGPNATHIFIVPGEYIVRGWLASGNGAVRECAAPLRINITFPESAMALAAHPNPTTSNTPVLFTAGIASRVGNITHGIWQFGDGGYSYSKDPSVAEHAYAVPGNYTATLTLTMEEGGSLVRQLAVQVLNAPPKASGRISPETGDATTNFALISESSDGDGKILTYLWDFGDGQSSSLPRAAHSYATHGTYNVLLTVSDDWGATGNASFLVTVVNIPPAVSLRAKASAADVGASIGFDASGTGDPDDPATALGYRWEFGDGKTASGMSVEHSYASPGKYVVRLTVDDGAGGSTSKTITVTVREKAAPQAGWQLPAVAAGACVAAASVAIYLVQKKRRRQRAPVALPTGNGDPRPVRKKVLKR